MTATVRLKQAWPVKRAGRTGQPVRRGSQPFEAAEGWYRPQTRQAVATIMRAARRLASVSMKTRKPGERRGDLTDIDLQILEVLLFEAMDWASGKLDWTYEQIARATRRARDTIARSLEALERVGILERMRRFVRTEVDGQGPQVQQAANAYRVGLPPRLAALIGLGKDPPGVPADALWRAQQRVLDVGVMEEMETSQPTLGGALSRLGSSLERRESSK